MQTIRYVIKIYEQMLHCYWISFFLALSCLFGARHASLGDADPSYKNCLGECEKSGCVGKRCFPHCTFSSDGASLDFPWYTQEPSYMRWKQWDCQSDCRYYCMLNSDRVRSSFGHGIVKYHSKWPFKRVFGIQQPASVAFSALNLAMHFHGWLSFFILLYYKLPTGLDKKPYYDYAGLFHLYGLLALNSWFWGTVFHSRDVEFTGKLHYFSGIVLVGYSLILAILRCFNVKLEAARVMVSAPLLAFVTVHILYLNNYQMDYGMNMKVCVVMAAAQLLIWAIWAGTSCHPSRQKLWLVVVAGAAVMLLEIYDFPSYEGFLDAHTASHAITIPLTYTWWSFIKDDVEFTTSTLLKNGKMASRKSLR
ncbi:post-GPI attachment to proteins factor 3-like [Cynara cardunculus var. scolymus]|uniref:post-GPI attachment to proteins factor 3-like n=1 Tax=Cynara cardunculus var. scolymus TaxID=59895 RepID=UPI000D624E24|nr:post-GPI attachment to proteins factor 3-like [Cynara cardunculus var. scolymus]